MNTDFSSGLASTGTVTSICSTSGFNFSPSIIFVDIPNTNSNYWPLNTQYYQMAVCSMGNNNINYYFNTRVPYAYHGAQQKDNYNHYSYVLTHQFLSGNTFSWYNTVEGDTKYYSYLGTNVCNESGKVYMYTAF